MGSEKTLLFLFDAMIQVKSNNAVAISDNGAKYDDF